MIQENKAKTEQSDKYHLQMRRNRDFLWVSPKDKRIYLKEEKSCLILYFTAYQEMLEYIQLMTEKGYAVG